MDMSFLGDESFADDPDGAVHDVAQVMPGDDLDDPGNHLWMHADGRVWDLGPAELDTDDDGVSDSLTRNGPDGITVYTDSDRDGQVDKITNVDTQGVFSSRALDPDSGIWVPTDSGRLG
ncbi:hypothetical protein GORHZ_064_00190 [Gordonia rhizosphera NBRC 16068]|uniref:DUF6802 domain-containing protein n=2 Tax=Gordonia rhizosphera TaxID=83341 RepID=K6WBF4_9ACTN|nr:hypothetical protein GORHZ_064_00190 [Gordonia rhizosphera NBRC 16068]